MAEVVRRSSDLPRFNDACVTGVQRASRSKMYSQFFNIQRAFICSVMLLASDLGDEGARGGRGGGGKLWSREKVVFEAVLIGGALLNQ